LILPDGTERRLEGDLTIGRGDDNDLELEPTTVSRRHARLVCGEGGWFLEDRGSYNGTFLNGVRIQPGIPMLLRHADVIGIGSEKLVFSAPDQLGDPYRTEPITDADEALAQPLSAFQRQVVQALCSSWLAGATLEDLPSNEDIARQLGTPGAAAAVKAALRRVYAKAGLTVGPPHAKRRALCRVARQRGWI
jgi:pSer/pThr/pTyr-binding forkhead associated (FHA) protein